MKPYYSIFKIRAINSLQYRTAAIAGVITQCAFGLMYILLYKAFYSFGNAPSNFNEMQMISYLWLQQMFFGIFYVSIKNQNIILQIEQGNICYEMVRPINLYSNWFASLYADNVSKTLLRFIPVAIFAMLLPAGWGLGAPVSFAAFVIFLINLIVGSLLVVSMNMLCYCLMFKTMSSIGIFSIMATMSSIFNGSMIPLPLTPVWFQKFVNFLPFRYVNDLTFRTYVGSIAVGDAIGQTAIQIVWLIAFVFIGNLWLNKNLKKVEVQGG